jgi:hypothetical protein
MKVMSVPALTSESDGRAEVDAFIALIDRRARRWLRNRLAQWERAQIEFQRRGYASTSREPQHPLIAPIAEYQRWGVDTMPPPAVVQLIEIAAAVNAFKPDWNGQEPWLFARLLDDNGCKQALFELRSAFYLQGLGHDVEYLSPKKQKGPDLCIHHAAGDIFAECVQMDPNAGHRVPGDAAEEIARQLMRHMDKTGQNRLVHLRCRKRLEARDTDMILRETKAALDCTTGGPFELLDGKYQVEVKYGGSQVAPLDLAAAKSASAWLNARGFHLGDVRALDRVITPHAGRYVARGVRVVSDESDAAVERTCDAAISKSDQLVPDAAGIILAEFGMPVMETQARWLNLKVALAQQISPRLVRHPEISAIALMFPVEVRRLSAAAGSTVVLSPTDVVHWFENQTAAKPLPEGFQWRVEKADLLADSEAG